MYRSEFSLLSSSANPYSRGDATEIPVECYNTNLFGFRVKMLVFESVFMSRYRLDEKT